MALAVEGVRLLGGRLGLVLDSDGSFLAALVQDVLFGQVGVDPVVVRADHFVQVRLGLGLGLGRVRGEERAGLDLGWLRAQVRVLFPRVRGVLLLRLDRSRHRLRLDILCGLALRLLLGLLALELLLLLIPLSHDALLFLLLLLPLLLFLLKLALLLLDHLPLQLFLVGFLLLQLLLEGLVRYVLAFDSRPAFHHFRALNIILFHCGRSLAASE